MKRFWKSLGLGVLYMAGYLLVQVAVFAIMGAAISAQITQGAGAQVSPEALREAIFYQKQAMTLHILVVINAMAALLIWGACALRKRRLGQGLGFARMKGRSWALSAALGIAMGVAVALIMGLLPEALLEGYAEQSGLLEAGSLGVRLLSVALVAPMVEEMLFRGLLYGALREGMARPVAILLSSAAFAAMHGHPLWMAYAALLGALLCWVRDVTGSLWAATAFHVGFNLSGSFLMPWLTPLLASMGASYGMMLAVPIGVCLLLGRELRTWAKGTA